MYLVIAWRPLTNFIAITMFSLYDWNKWSDEHMWWLALESIIHEERFMLWQTKLLLDKVLTIFIPLWSTVIWLDDWIKWTWFKLKILDFLLMINTWIRFMSLSYWSRVKEGGDDLWSGVEN